MFFFSLIVCFIIFITLASLLKWKHKVIVSFIGALVVSWLIQILEQFYFSGIIIAGLILYFVIGNIKTFKNEQLKLAVAVLFSAVLVTLTLTFTYFNQISDTSNSNEVLRVMFIYYPLLIIFIACYTYMLLSLFNFKVLQVSNPLRYIVNKIRGFMRMMQLFWIASRKGLHHLIQHDNAKLPYVIAGILDDMGGVFVKFAQVLSTKKDILPSNYIDAFSSLHDQVKPLSEDELKTIMDNKIGNLDEIYESFEMRPIAAASIGQVHLAKLKSTGETVVVKVLRPNVKQKMTADLDLLIQFVSWLSERSSKMKRLGLIELAKGFKKNLLEETDFDIEALNTNTLRKAFKENDIRISVPKIYSEYSNKHVLTMEYIEGDSFTKEVAADVSEMIMHAFLDQILIIGIFHADPHPGNIMLTTDGEVALIDFGSVGYLSDDERGGMLSFLMGYSNNDTKEMTQGLLKVCEEENALDEDIIEQRLSRLLSEASFAHDPTSVLMERMMRMITEMGLSLKPTVAGAFRALITLDGTLSSVDKQYALTAASESYASHMEKGQLVEERLSKVKVQLEDYIPKLLDLPILKSGRVAVVREENHHLNDFIGTLTVSIFTVICMIVMLTSFFVQSEVMQFLLAPLSISGFGVGMIILIMSVIRQLRL